MKTERIHFLLEPGEALTLPQQSLTQVARLHMASQILGMDLDTDPDSLVTSTAVSIPLPRYRDGKPLRGTPGVRPSALRYPFMWLPADLRERYDIAGENDETTPESDDVWMLRVAFELWQSGAYDIDSAGWLDILGLFDLDPDDPVDAARIEAWWDGADDEVLDAIDISDMFTDPESEDSDWAIIAASSLAEVFVKATVALSAADITALCELVEEGNTTPLGGGDARNVVPNLVRVARARMLDVPDVLPALGDLLDRSQEGYSSDQEILDDIVSPLKEILGHLFDEHAPYLHGVLESDLAGGPDEEDIADDETDEVEQGPSHRAEIGSQIAEDDEEQH